MSDRKYIEKAEELIQKTMWITDFVKLVAQLIEEVAVLKSDNFLMRSKIKGIEQDKERLEAELKTFHEQGLQVYGRKIRVLNETIDRLGAEVYMLKKTIDVLRGEL